MDEYEENIKINNSKEAKNFRKTMAYVFGTGALLIALSAIGGLTKALINNQPGNLEQKTQNEITVPADATQVNLDTLKYQNYINYFEVKDSSYISQ